MEEEDNFAVLPPVETLRITCDLIPWEIVVQGSNGWITCGDVIFSLHSALQRTLLAEDFESLATKQKDIIRDAYSRRCRMRAEHGLAKTEESEKRKGLKWVDWLGNRSFFIGLAPSFDQEETWILTLNQRDRMKTSRC
jgi:hypothetical protein